MSFEIKLNTIEKVKEFAKITYGLDSEVYCTQGRYTIDGKSIMAIFSLDLSNTITVRVENEDRQIEIADCYKIQEAMPKEK